MPPDPVEPLQKRRFRPPVALIDANVFARSAWIRPIVRAVQDGTLIAVWSPLVISEVNRLLTWLWIRRHGNDTSESSRRRCSADFKIWYQQVALFFHVVDDRPPLAPMWTDLPPDPWDAPIWTAAVRAKDAFGVSRLVIVTDNLKDAPPLDASGAHQFNDILFVHPDDLVSGIAHWINLDLTGRLAPNDELSSERATSGHVRPPHDRDLQLEAFLQSFGHTPNSDGD